MEVTVVGGGIIGLCSAYYLRKGGADVLLVDKDRVGSGATHGNAGWIVPIYSAPLPAPGLVSQTIRSMLRPDSPVYIKPRLAIDLPGWLFRFWRRCNLHDHLAGLHATARLAERTMYLYDELAADGVEFEMHSDGLLFAFLDEDKAKHALEGLEPMTEHGYRLPEGLMDGDSLRALEPALSGKVRAGFHITAERHVHPGSLIQGLARRLVEVGVKIREHARVGGFEVSAGRVSAVRIDGASLPSDALVLAAGAWTPQLARSLSIRIPMQAGKGYSFSIRPEVMPSRPLYLGEAKVGATPLGDRLRLAGTMELSGVNTRMDRRRIAAIGLAASRFLEGYGSSPIEDEWNGMRPVTPDGLPLLGKVRGFDNLYLATGHAMLGITLGPPSGEAIADEILSGKRPESIAPFTPDRLVR